MKYYTYILKSINHDEYYVGQTNNMTERISRHNKGYEKYTSKYKPWKVALTIEKNSRSEAIILERRANFVKHKRIITNIHEHINQSN